MKNSILSKLTFTICFFVVSFILSAENKLSIGLGFGVSNLNDFYRGSSVVAPIPIINARYENFFFDGFNIGLDLFNADAFTFSLFVNPLDGNYLKSKKMDDGYKSIDDRHYQIAAGALVGYDFNFYDTRALISMSGSRKGTKGNVKIIKPFTVTDKFYMIPSISENLYSKNYTDYYWGIDSNELGGKITNTYSPNMAYSTQLELAMEYYLNEKITLLAFMSVEKFSSDVERSPIIDNSTLMIMGAGIKYSF
ncbi:MAG: MipA/OmpV family protein [Fusobacteriaceae bacterium]|jgi:outer membrane protein|nr:MipA/OmpV family protein [Fusobacteriaceae bacterium]